MSLLHEFSRHLAHSIPPPPPSQAEGKSRIERKSSRVGGKGGKGEFVKGGMGKHVASTSQRGGGGGRGQECAWCSANKIA